MSTELERLVSGAHHDPHAFLGAHPAGAGRTVIRTLRPEARSVHAVAGGKSVPLRRIHDAGVFEGELPGALTDYRLTVEYGCLRWARSTCT
jgi:1,4-alpha-glucan branching enzyme